MTIDTYQKEAHKTSRNTSIGGIPYIYPLLGLAGETGEVADKVKKLFRDHNGIPPSSFQDEITKELGDILWYVSETCTQMGIDLNDVAKANLKKLAQRKKTDKIRGDGDNR